MCRKTETMHQTLFVQALLQPEFDLVRPQPPLSTSFRLRENQGPNPYCARREAAAQNSRCRTVLRKKGLTTPYARLLSSAATAPTETRGLSASRSCLVPVGKSCAPRISMVVGAGRNPPVSRSGQGMVSRRVPQQNRLCWTSSVHRARPAPGSRTLSVSSGSGPCLSTLFRGPCSAQ